MNDTCAPTQCSEPNCCDMRGLLSFQLLWELRDQPLNGQQLARRIAKRRGTKPTPGTLYPALKELKRKQMIVGNRAGRQVVYGLTNEGKQELYIA